MRVLSIPTMVKIPKQLILTLINKKADGNGKCIRQT